MPALRLRAERVNASVAAMSERRRMVAILGSLMLVMLLAALDQTIVATALPTIVGDLGGLEHLSWVVTAYLLAQTVVTPLYGKLGDLFGRKRVLQAAIVVFLIGSILCGLARTMPELIAFRAVQGLGGGGLMVGAQAALGDVVPPRERGRYTGLFIAIFGAASVAGPLLGGFITAHLSWEWIFYINLPLGIAAFAVLAGAFPTVRSDARPSIDVAGSALLAIGLTAVVLVTTLGGTSVGWASPEIAGLAAVGAAALVAFFLVERRAAEPILPPRLWRSATFRITSAVGLIIGFALFGAVTFLPLFQQVVRGESPTASGLQLLPLMGGVMVSSVASGRMIAATGHYRPYPIVGTGLTVVGMLLLSTMGPGTGIATAAAFMAVLGCGLGMVMQVLILAVQNDAPYEDLGVATAGATLFRSIGGSLGTAVLGAVFTNRLVAELGDRLPAGAGDVARSGNVDPASVGALPDPVRSAYLDGFSAAFTTVFLAAAGVAAVAFALTWLIREVPLRTTVRGGPREAAAAPAAGGDPIPG
ncbi:MAG TPA: MDR family MFS transporter [Miltoncostaeaceae bacterium]|nr:MDR family MFS transporter [Miltoncostaeaceae bacterium]